jgi:hypothetical protein
MNASQLLDKALLKVESQSIINWVLTQRETWEQIAQIYVDKKSFKDNQEPDDDYKAIMLCCDIVFTAIG